MPLPRNDFATCKLGTEQSPINIKTTDMEKARLDKIEFIYLPSKLNIANNGHTVAEIPVSMSDNIRLEKKQRLGAIMLNPAKYLACLAVLICMTMGQSEAASSAASSASDSIGTSVGSASGSLQTSSGSSSKGHTLAEGDYRIVVVAPAPDRPGSVRLKLQAMVDNIEKSELFLYVPQAAFDHGRLAQGGTVTARKRSYGAEFANAETRQVFFLVLDDDWYRELRANAVAL